MAAPGIFRDLLEYYQVAYAYCFSQAEATDEEDSKVRKQKPQAAVAAADSVSKQADNKAAKAVKQKAAAAAKAAGEAPQPASTTSDSKPPIKGHKTAATVASAVHIKAEVLDDAAVLGAASSIHQGEDIQPVVKHTVNHTLAPTAIAAHQQCASGAALHQQAPDITKPVADLAVCSPAASLHDSDCQPGMVECFIEGHGPYSRRLDLSKLQSFKGLWRQLSLMFPESLPHYMFAKLVYLDASGDWVIVSPDERWSTFASSATKIMVSSKC